MNKIHIISFILLASITIAMAQFTCVPVDSPATNNLDYCAQALANINHKVISALFTTERQAINDALAYSMSQSHLPSNASEECEIAFAKLVCSTLFPACDIVTNMIVKYPCESVITEAEIQCNIDLHSFSYYPDGMCATLETTNCYGIESNEPDVCSGHGSCIGTDECACEYHFSGENCDSKQPSCVSLPSDSIPFCTDVINSFSNYTVNTEYYMMSFNLQAPHLTDGDNMAFNKFVSQINSGVSIHSEECDLAFKKIVCMSQFPKCNDQEVSRLPCPSLCQDAYQKCGPMIFKGVYPHEYCAPYGVECIGESD
jgi:hypothetical protein